MDPTVATQTTPFFNPSFATLFGYLNIFAGVMLVISIVLMVTGYIYFFARMGLDSVSTAFVFMKYGVVTLFTLVMILVLCGISSDIRTSFWQLFPPSRRSSSFTALWRLSVSQASHLRRNDGCPQDTALSLVRYRLDGYDEGTYHRENLTFLCDAL